MRCVRTYESLYTVGPQIKLPPERSTFYWQLDGAAPTNRSEQVYDIDGFENNKSVFDTLKNNDKYVIAYFSAGSWEEWRPDANSFPSAVIGSEMDDWGERWIDIRNISAIKPIMEARADIALGKGADAIEWDNIDAFQNSPGFSITSADQQAYNKMLADITHERGMAVIYKNAALSGELEPYFDGLLIEEAYEWNETNAFIPYRNAGKAVWAIEYEGVLNCTDAQSKGVYLARYPLDLDGPPLATCPI